MGFQDTSHNMVDYLYFKWQGVYIKVFPPDMVSTLSSFSFFCVESLSKETKWKGFLQCWWGEQTDKQTQECIVKNAAQGAWRCGNPVAEHWLELDVGMKLHPCLGGNDAVAVLNSSSQLQLFQLLPQVLPLLLLLLFPETSEQRETRRLPNARVIHTLVLENQNDRRLTSDVLICKLLQVHQTVRCSSPWRPWAHCRLKQISLWWRENNKKIKGGEHLSQKTEV